jgi:predicted metal-dependent hydrolase
MDRRTRRKLIECLNRDGEVLAGHFGLRYLSITAERANTTSRYGSCCEDGGIKIRLNHAVTGEPLKYSSLVSTLCHELAHLRHFNHGERFRSFNQQILAHARVCEIYQPSRKSPAVAGQRPHAAEPEPTGTGTGPVQLALF